MASTLLMLDYDRKTFPPWAMQRIEILAREHRLRVRWIVRKRSGSGNGWHVVISVDGRVAFWRVVLYQALLGSDWKREMFNASRARVWRNVPLEWRRRANVLYHRHYKGAETMSPRGDLAYGEMREKLEPDDTDGKPAVLRIKFAERRNMARGGRGEKWKIIVVFMDVASEDGTNKEMILNATDWATASGKLGEDEKRWAGKFLVVAPVTTNYDGKPYEKQHCVSPARWDKLQSQFDRAALAAAKKPGDDE